MAKFNPELAHGFQLPVKKHFLGFATINVVLSNDGGRGPKFQDSPGQRPLSQSTVKALYDLGGGENAEGFLRLDHKHSMVYLISGKVIDKSCLTQDHMGTFKPIKWLDGAKNTQAIRCSGKHRTEALKLCMGDTISTLSRIRAEWLRNQANEELRRKIIELTGICDIQGYWTIKIYDKGQFNIFPSLDILNLNI